MWSYRQSGFECEDGTFGNAVDLVKHLVTIFGLHNNLAKIHALFKQLQDMEEGSNLTHPDMSITIHRYRVIGESRNGKDQRS